jgi:tripartite-type tricarboxylate transporter receptor subunit TctC
MKKLMTSAAIAVALIGTAATAQDYPSKQVTLVAPYSAGGASDSAARALAEAAKKYLGQPISVENRTGAGGMVGARSVVDSEADGYTLLLARVGMALDPAVNPQAMVDWDEYDFLGALESTPMMLVVKSDSDYTDVASLVKAIKESDGRMTYGASGATAIDGFTVQAMLADAGLDPLTAATLVPYKGGNEMATALQGGHIDFLAVASASLMPGIESGALKPLAVFAPTRMEQLPDVPTMAEAGYETAGLITGWSALYGPKDLPEEVHAKWDEVLDQVATDETWLEMTKNRGAISTVGTVKMADYAKEQYDLFKGLAVKFGYLPE